MQRKNACPLWANCDRPRTENNQAAHSIHVLGAAEKAALAIARN